MEDDFAATTTIGERVAPQPVANVPKERRQQPSGSSFGTLSKLEPFLLLAKSARGAAAASLISQACAAPGVYAFSELLELPSIHELQSSEQHGASYRLLQVFAYGTWSDYKDSKASLPSLNAAQENKLRQLSILTLAQQSRTLPYNVLVSRLELPSVAALEDLLIDGIYSGIMTARLDQKLARLEVLTTIGRDVKQSTSSVGEAKTIASESMEVDTVSTASAPTVQALTDTLSTWLSTIHTLLASLDQHIVSLSDQATSQKTAEANRDAQIKQVIEEVAKAKEKESSTLAKGKGFAAAVMGAGGGEEGASWRDTIGKVFGGSDGGQSKEEMDVDGSELKSPHSRARKRGRA
ncbi:hypothetical protein OIV83_003249 [Microbotryomycetes sp. JL201]|nr:hypothetical protein OIV83_003249 [Microbotryomycetes sp. JL201]